MKLDLLTILLPKSLDMGSIGSGKSHDSITPQEVSTILSYANLVKAELNILMGKYLEDESATHDLIKYAESYIEMEDKKLVKKIAHTAVIELFTDTTCFFCNGTGQVVFQDSVDKCLHCHDGIFVWSDFSRSAIMGLKKGVYMKIKKDYKELIKHLIDIEQSALEKLGDS
jgi:aspartate carbamoyltransferase regulatory subunit